MNKYAYFAVQLAVLSLTLMVLMFGQFERIERFGREWGVSSSDVLFVLMMLTALGSMWFFHRSAKIT
jgi:hypothetical protein